MQMMSLASIGIGATLGAWLRWWLGSRYNAFLTLMPLGTLLANLIGGYVIGVLLGLIEINPAFPVQARLLLITGFCGGLTTFSTFSAETVSMLMRGELLWGVLTIAAHLLGSLVCTVLGIYTVRLLRMGSGVM